MNQHRKELTRTEGNTPFKTLNQRVGGSSPPRLTIIFYELRQAPMNIGPAVSVVTNLRRRSCRYSDKTTISSAFSLIGRVNVTHRRYIGCMAH